MPKKMAIDKFFGQNTREKKDTDCFQLAQHLLDKKAKKKNTQVACKGEKQMQKNQELRREMKSRHLFMISLGGVIGTGLFLSSGYTIGQAGPGGTLLAYMTGGFVMYLVMLCLGELAVAMPVAGSFQTYATRYLSPSIGFTVGWMYWLNWAVTVGLEFTSAGMLMKRWFPGVPIWVWCLVFAAVLFSLNALSAKSYAESEFWFASIKVTAIILFIIIGGAAMFGFLSMDGKPAPGLSNFTGEGGLFPNGLVPVMLTMIAVNFSFQGTELIGIAAGESENPEKTIPQSIRTTIWRTMFFFIAAVFVLVSLIPWKEAGLVESPFVLVFDQVGIPYAADIMNFVILTAVLSVGNSGLYAASRMMYGMAKSGMASPKLAKLNSKGVPFNALLVTLSVASLSLLTSVFAADTIYLWLISIAGMAALTVWISIAAAQFMFRKRYLAEGGRLEELKFRTPLYPLVPIAAFVLNVAVLVSMAFVEEQQMALKCGIPFIIGCLLYYKFVVSKRKHDLTYDVEKEYEDLFHEQAQ